jgi:hypothetical protein
LTLFGIAWNFRCWRMVRAIVVDSAEVKDGGETLS